MNNLGDQYIKGDCIKITSIPASAANGIVINVWDASGVLKVDAQDMTEVSSTEFTYDIETDDNWTDDTAGTKKCIVQTIATTNTCENVEEDFFILNSKTHINV